MPQRKRIGSKAKLAAYFRSRVGKVLGSRELQEASGGAAEWARRIRDLRSEGWDIKTHNDLSSLKPGEYILASDPPPEGVYKFEKPVSHRIRAQVLERNGYTCQMCGAGAGEPDDQNPGRNVRLHIGHIIDRSHGGLDELGNLRALCSTCNQGAKNLVQEPPTRIWLLSQIRRAKIDDQKAALEWLKQKLES